MRTLALPFLLSAAALAACASDTAKLQHQPASNTAFMAFVPTGSGGKIYMPAAESATAPNILVAVVDAAAPSGSSGVLRYLDLGGGASARAAGASGTEVAVIERDAPAVHFIDAVTDTVRGAAPFPAEAQLMLTSNAPGYYSSGVAVDAASRRAYVSVSFGYLEYDLDSRLLTRTFQAPTAEGFALDTGNGRLYSPFYLCNPNPDDPGICYPYTQPGGPDLTDSLTVIDLASSRSYSLVDPAAADPHAPLGFDPDDVAVDYALQVAAVANEEAPTLQVLDLAAATYDDAALTFRIPRVTVPMPGPFYTALAADQATHLLVVVEEDGTGLAFVDLEKARKGQVSMLPVSMPAKPNGDPWTNLGDPHGAIVGVVDGRSYAFVGASDRNWLARIDLAGVKGVMAGQGTFAAQVQFISVPSPP